MNLATVTCWGWHNIFTIVLILFDVIRLEVDGIGHCFIVMCLSGLYQMVLVLFDLICFNPDVPDSWLWMLFVWSDFTVGLAWFLRSVCYC